MGRMANTNTINKVDILKKIIEDNMSPISVERSKPMIPGTGSILKLYNFGDCGYVTQQKETEDFISDVYKVPLATVTHWKNKWAELN